jgi:hypothetical protein
MIRGILQSLAFVAFGVLAVNVAWGQSAAAGVDAGSARPDQAVAPDQSVAPVQPQPAPGPDEAPQPSAPYPGAPGATGDMAAQREQIWNSPQMLRARAWLQEYTARSARISPSEARQYMEELSQLTPTQMKLWLLKFQEQEEMMQRQQAAFEAGRQESVSRAMQFNQATQQSVANINLGSDDAADAARQSLAQQEQATRQMGLQKDADRNEAVDAMRSPAPYIWANTLPWGPYAGYPAGGPVDPGARFGHYHVHYHMGPAAGAAGAAGRR